MTLRQYHSRSAIATTINVMAHRDCIIVGIQYLRSATFSRLDRVEPRWRRHRYFIDSLSNEWIYTLLPSQLHFFPNIVYSDPSLPDPLRICFDMSLTLAAAIKLLIHGFKHSKLKKADLRIGQQLNLLPDNENRHDANAIAVKTSDGDHIGHMVKEVAFVFIKLIAFAICHGVLIVGALKGVQHGRFNELLFEFL